MHRFKLKHLKKFEDASKPLDVAYFMIELFNYKNSFFFKTKNFKECFKKTYSILSEVQKTNITKVEVNESVLKIKYPKNIDTISFKSMMSLQSAFSNTDLGATDFIVGVISTSCYESNYSDIYGDDELQKRTFENRILNSPFLDMCGLFNLIKSKFEKSNDFWNKEFMKVEVQDNDYNLAGGSQLSKFNIIKTIKTIAQDFNCTDDEAWKKSYALTQTNSLEKATSAFVQNNMSKIKEDRMKSRRNS